MRGIKQVLGRVDWLSVFFTLLFLVAVVLLGLSFIGPHATAFAIAGSTGAPIFFGALVFHYHDKKAEVREARLDQRVQQQAIDTTNEFLAIMVANDMEDFLAVVDALLSCNEVMYMNNVDDENHHHD